MEAGRKVAELNREYGVSPASIYAWKSRYAGLEVSQLRRLKEPGCGTCTNRADV